MKRSSIQTFAILALTLLVISGCGLQRMVKNYDDVNYETTPNPLEVHGEEIKVTIKGTIPEKYFPTRAIVEFTPVLKYEGGSTQLKTITLKGEKADGDGILINRKSRTTFTYEDVIAYDPAMNKSELFVNAVARMRNNEVELGEIKLADGVIYTSERIGRGENIALAPHGYEKEVIISKAANIFFAQNLHNLNMSLPHNRKAENREALEAMREFAQNGWLIRNVEINAWASPEGEESFNKNLSENRAKTAERYMNDYFRNVRNQWRREKKEFQEDININLSAKGEDWQGFVQKVQASDITDKNAILNVVNAHTDVAKREQEIRNMAVIYKEIEDGILPALRRAEIIVHSYEPKRTDEEIAMLSTSSPDSLDNKELLYAATLTEDLNTKLTIYKNATLVFPEDWKGYNNAGNISLKLNNLEEAGTYLEKANTLSPNNGKVLNNLGVLAAWNGEYAKANSYYESAQAQGFSVTYNFAPLNIKKGEYAAAIGNMSGTTCDYNLALAQLLNGDNNAALATLECIADKDAQAYYLLAVTGARMNNSSVLYNNLRQAVQKDPTLKAVAKEDREFIRFFSNTEFENIVR